MKPESCLAAPTSFSDTTTRLIFTTILAATLAVLLGAPSSAWAGPKFDHVIHISVDGLRADFLQQLIDNGRAPTFARLQHEAAWTHNARTDFDFTITLPNHTSMITGRPVLTPEGFPPNTGHGHTTNGDPGPTETLHIGGGRGGCGGGRGGGEFVYIASTFDVAHDHGLSTAMYASKTKFSLFDQTYNETNGRDDVIGADNGKDKIDTTVIDNSNGAAAVLIRGNGADVSGFVADMRTQHFNYAFVHLRDPDTAGHSHGWGSDDWLNAVVAVDGYLADIFAMIDADPVLKDSTAVIITADHGGEGNGHSDQTNPHNYTIPFYVWGPGVPAGADLYELNQDTRVDPGADRPTYLDPAAQPIRNGGSGNLALDLLGLEAIPGSIINHRQDLRVTVPEPASGSVGLLTTTLLMAKRTRHPQATR